MKIENRELHKDSNSEMIWAFLQKELKQYMTKHNLMECKQYMQQLQDFIDKWDRSYATYDWFLPNSIHVASLRDAGKEGVSIPHTAEPNGSLYEVIEIQPREAVEKSVRYIIRAFCFF